MEAAETAGALGETVKGPVMDYLVSGGSHGVIREDRTGRQLIFNALPASGFLDPGSWRVQPSPFYRVLIEKALAERQRRKQSCGLTGPGTIIPGHGRLSILRQALGCGGRAVPGPGTPLLRWTVRSLDIQSTTPRGYNRVSEKDPGPDGWPEQDRRMGIIWSMEGLRSTHARKKKFIGMLDVMEGKKVRKTI